jgi:hypothetical protein
MPFRELTSSEIVDYTLCTDKPLLEDFHRNNVMISPFEILIIFDVNRILSKRLTLDQTLMNYLIRIIEK